MPIEKRYIAKRYEGEGLLMIVKHKDSNNYSAFYSKDHQQAIENMHEFREHPTKIFCYNVNIDAFYKAEAAVKEWNKGIEINLENLLA